MSSSRNRSFPISLISIFRAVGVDSDVLSIASLPFRVSCVFFSVVMKVSTHRLPREGESPTSKPSHLTLWVRQLQEKVRSQYLYLRLAPTFPLALDLALQVPMEWCF